MQPFNGVDKKDGAIYVMSFRVTIRSRGSSSRDHGSKEREDWEHILDVLFSSRCQAVLFVERVNLKEIKVVATTVS